jgi:spermidine synthase
VHPKRIGIVGLGAGTLAAYKDEWMTMTYFEIDPVVIRVAQDPAFFTYLSDAPGAPDIVEGDARLSLAKDPDSRYDLLVLDAFSSDSIPIHLLTVEAITDELRTLAPDGVIAFHISNRYYQLAPAIAAALAELGLETMERASDKADTAGDPSLLPSRWLAASPSTERIAAFRALGWHDTIPASHPLTDDYADLLSYLHLEP